MVSFEPRTGRVIVMSGSATSPESLGVVIEEATEASPELVDAFDTFRDRLGRADMHYTPTAEHLEEIIRAPATRLFVARDGDGQILGALTLAVYRLPSGLRAWVEDVVVRPGETGRGLGGLLVEKGLVCAREAGAERVELLVDPNQVSARNMFQRMGFRPYDKSPYSMSL